ncbi:response regulator transcription factor [Thiomicrorhabdus aquaedulcis]|uniref:response regulator transcription factor n=1 Tax=Thiomicrorhabdus aquaedulcis TaxID=2211106 RepID=UPI000FD7CE3F|nr:winged helix-turn-helix domain-containing protein [Thiomicrorhabdus aquaedulcis]
MLSALGQTPNRIEGYEAGVNHYFAKPVNLDELVVVLKNHLQQHLQQQNPVNMPVYGAQSEGWRLDFKQLYCPNQRSIMLSSREKRILGILMSQPGKIVNKKELLEALEIEDDTYDYRRMDSMLYRLRKKAGQVCPDKFPLETVHSLGYSWVD